jgi:O-antigen/teichoic acid export membrane protein
LRLYLRRLIGGALPLVAIFTDPSKYGQAVLIYAFITIYSSLIMFGQGRSVLKYYNARDGQWVIPVVGCLTLFAAVLMSISTIFVHMNHPFYIMSISLLLAIYGLLALKIRVLDDIKLFALLRLPYVLLRLIFVFIALVFFDNIVFYIYAELFVVIFAFLISHILVKSTLKETKHGVNLKNISLLVGVGFPLFLNGLSTLVISNIDKILIGKYWSAAMVGQYAFIYALTSSITFIYAYFAIKYELLIYKSQDVVEAKKYANQFANKSLVAGVAFLPILVLFYYVSSILNVKIKMDFYSFGILFVGQVLYGVSLRFSYILTFLNNNIYILVSGLLAALFNVVANFYFLPDYGLLAAALVSSLSFFVMAVLMAVFCQLKHGYLKT